MTRLIRRYPVAAFFALAWVLSWLVMVPLALARHGIIAALPGWLHYLSAYGPLLAALLVSLASGDAGGVRAWGARLVHWRTAPAAWTLALSPILLYLAVAAIERATEGRWPDPRALGRVNFLPDLGLLSLPLWILNSGLGEEAGWRGFALPSLERTRGPRMASVLIALGWMVWHVPAFFYLPAYERMGPGMLVGFGAGVLSGSFLLTWLSARAGGSALLPAVWHGLFNWTTASTSSVGLLAAVSSTVFTVLGIVAVFRLGSASRPREGHQAAPEPSAPGRAT